MIIMRGILKGRGMEVVDAVDRGFGGRVFEEERAFVSFLCLEIPNV